MKNLLIIPFLGYILFVPASMMAQKESQEHAFIKYRMLLNEIETFIEWDNFEASDFQDFQTKILALEELTGIISHDDDSCWTGFTRLPVSYNLEDWQQWFRLNKNQLLIDAKSETFKTLNPPVPIVKDPKVYFLTLLAELETMLINDRFEWEKFKYIVFTLDAVTDFRDIHDSLPCSCDHFEDLWNYATLHHLSILNEWYESNFHKLYWDVETQKLAVMP